MAITFYPAFLNQHIAPGVSAFTAADIPDMSKWENESPHWVANFFLNSALGASFAPPMNAYAYNFLRRAEYAYSQHHLAREATLAFLAQGAQSVKHYVEALFHWECYLSQSWHAFSILITAWDGKAFDKNDGSVEQRLNALYNQMKHVESRIDNAQMLSGATVPVWLENEGLISIDTRLSYAETGEILKDIGKYANALMNPKTAVDELAKIDA